MAYYDNRKFSDFKNKTDWNDSSSNLGGRTSLHIMSILKKYATAAPNKYCVEFELTEAVSGYITKRYPSFFDDNSLKRIKLDCINVIAPEKNFSHTDAADSGHEEKVPYAYDINQLQLEFNCMNDMKERILFEYWMDFIYDVKGRSYMFLSDYATDFHIFQLNAKNEATYCVIAGRAFPIGVSSLRYDSGPSNTASKVVATVAYQYMDTLNYS